ncbi:putative polysaccharide biosynthesis protein [Enterococcus dispar]
MKAESTKGKENQMQKMMQGAFVLTVASFIAKVLSAIYRVPLQNLVGDQGFYVYQQVYPIYGLAMTLALSGLPQFISKYIAEISSVKQQKTAIQKLIPVVFYCGMILWGMTFFGAEIIAILMGNQLLAPLIRVVSFTFLLMPFLAFYRGNFQGQLQMVPSAVSQVVEQFVRVGVIIAAALMFQAGFFDVYETGTVAMSGAVAGGLGAVVLLVYYQKKISGGGLNLLQDFHFGKVDKKLLRRFVVEGGLLSIYTGFLILFQLIDSFVITNELQSFGLQQETAQIAKGVYDRGQPMVQLGLVVAAALSSTFLPALTKYLVARNNRLFQSSAKIYLRLTTSISLAASFGLALVMPSLNYGLFKDEAGNDVLQVFVFSVFLMAVIQSYQAIAQSQNHFRPALKAAVLGLGVKFGTTIILTASMGTLGASLGTIFGLAATLWRLIKAENQNINRFWRERAFSKKICKCLLVMSGAVIVFYFAVAVLGGFETRFGALVVTTFAVAVGGFAFIKAAIRFDLLTLREWLLLPFGKKLLRLKK